MFYLSMYHIYMKKNGLADRKTKQNFKLDLQSGLASVAKREKKTSGVHCDFSKKS